MEKSKHNGIISFWKFMFCLLIMGLHVAEAIIGNKNLKTNATIIFWAGSIGVEFFFLVSGYLLGKKAMNTENKGDLGEATYHFIKKKVGSFFPYILLTFIVAVPVYYSLQNLQKSDLVNSVWDLLLLTISGMRYHRFLGVVWYISAMLLCMILLFPLIVKYKKKFTYIIGPLIVILISGYIGKEYGNIANPWLWNGFVYKGLIRAFFEISLGVLLYSFTEKIKKVKFTKLSRILLTVIEIVGFTSIFFIVNLKDAHSKYDYIMILLLSISISLAFSEKTLLLKFCNNKIFYFLEKLSLPMYLNHKWIVELMNYVLVKNGIKEVNYYIELLVAIVISAIVSIIMINIIRFAKKILPKVKRAFIET